MPKVKTQKIKNVEYVYQESSFRVKGERNPRHSRRYLGKMVGGRFVPNAKYLLLPEAEQERLGLAPARNEEQEPGKRGRKPATAESTRTFYGATYLFDTLAERLGVTSDLRACFPDMWDKMLSLAWFLILEDRNPVSRFPRWGRTHHHPHGKDITSPRSSELFGSIGEDAIQRFFSRQVKRRLETEYLAYDTTSISTYSKVLSQARRGMNKEHNLLDQINLALVFGQQSRLPVCYRTLPGNISDVKTVRKLVRDLAAMGLGDVHLVMDRGFYSEENINGLYAQHYKFLVATKRSLRIVRNAVDEVNNVMLNYDHYHEGQDIYYASQLLTWEVKETNAEGEQIVKAAKRAYLHLYHDDQRAVNDRKDLNREIQRLKRELEDGHRIEDHANLYERYFTVCDTPKRGVSVSVRKDVVDEESKYYGYFALMSNDVKDPILALIIYRAKDVVEKAFGNLKERLGLRRPGVSSDANLQGKIFVQYIALIILSQVQNTMREKELYRDYTLYSLLDELDVIEYFEHAGNRGHVGEITRKQAAIYDAFDVTLPV